MLADPLWQQGLVALGCEPNDGQLRQLQQYLLLLQRWNGVYNLTAVRDPGQMLPVHLWDSLSVVPYVQASPCLDVGSGAGLPGIPLAIMQPRQSFTLLDTNGKKTRFIQQAVLELGLKNVSVAHARVEQWQPGQKFAAIVSRAFASVADFVNVTGAHLQEGGSLFAMKGRYPDAELAQLPAGWRVLQTHRLEVPGLDAERHLLEITQAV